MPGESILVVDDESSVRELIVEILEAAGFRVATARDGAEGLARMDAATPDLVLSDIGMPRMDGYAFYEGARYPSGTACPSSSSRAGGSRRRCWRERSGGRTTTW